MIKNCPMRHENGNCIPAGGFCTANKNICEALLNAYRMGKTQLFSESATFDTISRQAAIDVIEKNACNTQRIIDAVNNLPPAQPETAKRIVGKSRDGMTLWYQCDMCNEPVDEQDNYCRGCGRRLIDG